MKTYLLLIFLLAAGLWSFLGHAWETFGPWDRDVDFTPRLAHDRDKAKCRGMLWVIGILSIVVIAVGVLWK